MIAPLDVERLREEFGHATPFPHVVIDNFLDPVSAAEVAASYPTFEQAAAMGLTFKTVNERKKIQITDAALFPAAVRRLNDALSSPAFLEQLSAVTGIPHLLADDTVTGGGMHVTGPHGRLDVHVDFNLLNGVLHRRLNLLLYLNPGWHEEWGGAIELWDPAVTTCGRRLTPVLGRCLIFETSDISFHGVAPLRCPPDVVRRSFAAYYYTKEPPARGAAREHSTIFRGRPNERFRERVLMPAERLKRHVVDALLREYYRARRVAGRIRRRMI